MQIESCKTYHQLTNWHFWGKYSPLNAICLYKCSLICLHFSKDIPLRESKVSFRPVVLMKKEIQFVLGELTLAANDHPGFPRHPSTISGLNVNA